MEAKDFVLLLGDAIIAEGIEERKFVGFEIDRAHNSLLIVTASDAEGDICKNAVLFGGEVSELKLTVAQNTTDTIGSEE